MKKPVMALLSALPMLLIATQAARSDDYLQKLIDTTELMESGAYAPYICGCPLSSILEKAPNLGKGVSFTGHNCRSGIGGTCTGTCKYFFDPDGDGRGKGIIYPCDWIHYINAEPPTLQ